MASLNDTPELLPPGTRVTYRYRMATGIGWACGEAVILEHRVVHGGEKLYIVRRLNHEAELPWPLAPAEVEAVRP